MEKRPRPPSALGSCLALRTALLGMLWLGAPGCGSGSSAPSAQSAEDAPVSHRQRQKATLESEPGEDAAEEPEAAPQSSCDDGTCFRCGKGVCLSGWYCDESAPGGAACSWLPECNGKKSCACVSRVLGSGCTCKEQDDAPHVSCR